MSSTYLHFSHTYPEVDVVVHGKHFPFQFSHFLIGRVTVTQLIVADEVNNNVSNCVRSTLVLSAHTLGNCNLQHGGVSCDWTGSRSKEGAFLIKRIVTLWIIFIKESLKKKESIRTGANFKVGFDGDCQKNGQRDVSVGTSAKVWNWEQDGRCSANRGDRGKMMFFTQMTMMLMLMLTEIATMVKLKN